ncbi:hypothetical protein [Clostridium gasigenes]|uniref:hypothetical protein n=1 Tax=Clostridium gasigenes TaxID=94869 RepID=UPI001A9B62CB|nr:hypothetical protein [Clostridium gasigenes]
MNPPIMSPRSINVSSVANKFKSLALCFLHQSWAAPKEDIYFNGFSPINRYPQSL